MQGPEIETVTGSHQEVDDQEEDGQEDQQTNEEEIQVSTAQEED